MPYLRRSHHRGDDFWVGWTYGAASGIVGAPIFVLLVLRLLQG